MAEHLHPESTVPIRGTELSDGAILQKTDVYDSTNGKWEHISPALVGSTLREGHGAIFIRPDKELQGEA